MLLYINLWLYEVLWMIVFDDTTLVMHKQVSVVCISYETSIESHLSLLVDSPSDTAHGHQDENNQ